MGLSSRQSRQTHLLLKMNISFRKPLPEDLGKIRDILAQWTDQEEVDKYCQRITNEINGIVEYNTYFWVGECDHEVVGVAGTSDILPKTQSFSQGNNPVDLKILYLDSKVRGHGYGKDFLIFLINEAVKNGHDEMIIRTDKRYADTAWGFYQKMGFKLVGYIDDGMAVFRQSLP